MKNYIKLGFLALVLSQINGLTLPENSTCPEIQVTDDMGDPFIAQGLKREVIKDIWASPFLSKPTELVAQLRDIILEMSNSDSFYFTEFAFQFTGWSTCFLAEINHIYPNFCIFADIINKTAEWEETKDVNKYVQALQKTVEAVPYALSSHTHASLVQLGCVNITAPAANTQRCHQNGLVSNHDVIWNAYGRLMPWPLRTIAELLANSPLFSDRAYATILAFVLTPPQYFYFTNQIYPLFIETGRTYTYASNSSKCCCSKWIEKTTELNRILNETAVENANKKIDELLNGCK